MQVRLVYNPKGPCAYVYARSNDEKEKDKNIYKLWHNNRTNSLTINASINYENDFYIQYTSKIPLSTWVQTLQQSDYNDPKKYSLLSHNCAHAAKFALELANIYVFHEQQPYIYSLGILEPSLLFKYAKVEKLNQLSKQNLENNYRCHMSSINA